MDALIIVNTQIAGTACVIPMKRALPAHTIADHAAGMGSAETGVTKVASTAHRTAAPAAGTVTATTASSAIRAPKTAVNAPEQHKDAGMALVTVGRHARHAL